jgi:hypothetical protein
VPWAATLLARSWLLEGADKLYSGSAWGYAYASSLTSATGHYHKMNLWIWIRLALSVSSQKIFVFKLQWILVVFVFWPYQKAGFEASERNKDAPHASTARKLILDALQTIRVAAFLARTSPNRF